MQVLLLIVGVSLLAVGAIFFLVYAFITFGLVWRSLIIGAVTVAAFAGAWLLRRRRLTATAEAIAALAVVLVYLDAFALRANDLLGTAAVDGFVYWGVTLLVSSVGFVAWHRLSGLRAPSIAAFAVFAPALGCLVAGWTEPLDPTDRVFAAFAAMAIGGFVHVAAARMGPNHTTERVLAASFGVLGLVVAAGTAFLLRPNSQWAAAAGLGIVAALALAHVLVNVRTHGPRSVGAVASGIGAAAASFVALSAAVRADDSPIVRIAPVVAAAAVALALEAVLRRTSSQARPAALAATLTSIVVGAFIALPSIVGAALGTLMGVAGPLAHGIWGVPGNSAIDLGADLGPAVAALAIVVALAAGAWQLGRRLARRRLLVLWPAAGVAIAAVPLTGVLWAEVAGWSLLAGFAVVLLVLARDRSLGVRVLLAVAGATAIALGYAASWASTDTWWVGSLAAIVLLLVSRGATAAEPARATLLGAALVLLEIAAGAGAWRANTVLLGGAGALPEAAHGVLAIAIVVLALAAVLRGRVASELDARVAFWVSTAAIALYAPWSFGAGDAVLVVPDPAATAVLASGLVGVLALWTTIPSTLRLRPERIVASLALAPAGALALQGLARLAGLHETVVVHALAPVTAALIVAAASLAARPHLRTARDSGAALVAGGALVWSFIADPDATWLVLLITAITVLIFAISRDGAKRATLLGAALVLLEIAAGAGAWRANTVLLGGAGALPEAAHGVLAIAIVVLALAAVLRGRVASELDARVAFWVSTAAIALYAPWSFGAGDAVLVVPDPAATAVLASGLVGVLALWTTIPSTLRLRPERIVASLALAPAGALALQGLARLAGLHETVVVHALAPVTAALIVAAASLAARPHLRTARDSGAALVAGGALVWSFIADPDATWLVLLITAITVLIFAISRDGLFGSVSTRRHLVWASLALGTASLWRALADNPTARLEAYVLPLAGALFVIALLTWRAHRPEPSRTAPFIALAGLLVAIVPLAVVARDGELARTIAVFAAAALLAVLGGLSASRAVRPYLDSAAFVGSLGVLLAVPLRTAGMLDRGERGDLAIDAWLAAALVVLAIAATAQSRLGGRVRAVIAQVLLGLGLGLVTAVELVAIDSGSLGAARAIVLLVVLAVVHVTASVVARAPFTPAIGWLAIGLAAVTALVVTGGGVVDPLEGATAPIAAGLLVAGAVHLHRVPAARSWATLAPGILVLLVPSLIATFVDDALWRLVALGLACVALIVVGALVRLQAPLVLGSATVLVHAARTFAPQVRAIYESTEWWVWAVVGGSIILFLGFTLERRIRDLRSIATRVSALR